MTTPIHRHNVQHLQHRWTNLFEITNRHELTVTYRLLDIQGVPLGEYYDKNMNQLVKALRYEMRQPVALLRRGNTHCLAIPADIPLPQLQRRLIPHIVTLVPHTETYLLDFSRLDEETMPIALAFLQFTLGTPLHLSQDLWGSGRTYYYKQALNSSDSRDTIDLYPGFTWSVTTTEGGRLFLAVDTTVRYIDRNWLSDRLHGGDLNKYLHRHCLYEFGDQWYIVQLWGQTGLSVADQQFVLEGEDQIQNVFSYTKENWRNSPPLWVRDLEPNSPAIIYRYPGNEKTRYGALNLCKLLFSTTDDEVASLHHYSILSPSSRFKRVMAIVDRHFQQTQVGRTPIQVAHVPFEIESRNFPIPPLQFGKHRILAVDGMVTTKATDVVPLEQLGPRRLQLALDPQVGSSDTKPFDAQYLLLPLSSPRSINEDFADQLQHAMRKVSGRQDYTAQRILYDDRQATSLYQQVQAIKTAISKNNISRGYALLVLPERAKPDLHNYIKRELWPHMQLQCAMARKIRSYYQPNGTSSTFQPKPDRVAKLASYIRGCSFGLMIVNRKWLWTLAAPLHYDVYVGIDVLNGMAGLTFVYDRGQHVFFRNYSCKQKERLTTPQLRAILVRHLRDDLTALNLKPQSIVVHRDGRSFGSELTGLHQAIQALKGEGILVSDIEVGVVDIRKTTTEQVRMVEGESLETVQNCPVGSYSVLNQSEGVICTTGRPFRFPGTAKPLTAVIVQGTLDVPWMLEDIFALSQLTFTAPDKCARLPITVKLADDFLEPIASKVDDEEALYETEASDELELSTSDEFMAS